MSDWFSNNFVEIFLGGPSFRLLQAMLFLQNTWPPGDGLFCLIWLKYKLEKSSSTKVYGRFSKNICRIFLGWPSLGFHPAMFIGQKTWLPWVGAVLPYMAYLNKVSSKSIWPIFCYIYLKDNKGLSFWASSLASCLALWITWNKSVERSRAIMAHLFNFSPKQMCFDTSAVYNFWNYCYD